MHSDQPDYDHRIAVSVRTACDLTSLGRTSVFAALSSGVLTRCKVGRRTLVTMESIRRLLGGTAL